MIGGSAADLHRSSGDLISSGAARRIRILGADGPALVIGRGQPDTDVDRRAAQAAAVAVVRRPSGGSAVLVGPGEVLWVDVTVPVDDPLWCSDVGQAGWWLGECWAAALGDVGIAGAEVWRGAMVRSAWSPLVCFAGLGPGEVTVGRAKVVGVAQRRTRLGALFQCAVPLGGQDPVQPWEPTGLLELLALSPDRRREAAVALAGAAGAVGCPEHLAEAFVGRCQRRPY